MACMGAMAQDKSPIAAAAQSAIETSPDLGAKFNAFRASIDEVDAAKAGFKPKVDLGATLGRSKDRVTITQSPPDLALTQKSASLTLTQMLWDGLATRNDVNRLDHAKLSKYFDFVDSSEQVALDAVKAQQDVQRYRRLVQLAEDNYVQHKSAYEQIRSRVEAKVSPGVDLEQVAARLALAESNLVTERSNLNDVTERYRRIVGSMPSPEFTGPVPPATPLPPTSTAALEAAALQSPAIAAAIENVRAIRAQVKGRKSAYQPRLDARLSAGTGQNIDYIQDKQRDATAELVLTWNLFNGGADQARERQFARLLTQAEDLRDKACRDDRQTVAIAYNDSVKLSRQIDFLNRNVIAIEKTRNAYRQQFDIGQNRSLLDLLNAENELYTAKRSYAQAEYDRTIADYRVLAGMGRLVSSLGLAPADTPAVDEETKNWAVGEDGAVRCPLGATEIAETPRAELDARAQALVQPAKLATPVATPSSQPAAQEGIAAQRLRDWAAAWMAKDLSRYYSFYSPSFGPIKYDKARWMADRKRLVTKPGEIQVKLEDIQTKLLSPTRVETSFKQTYNSYNFNDTMQKTLTWERSGSEWLIVKETNR